MVPAHKRGSYEANRYTADDVSAHRADFVEVRLLSIRLRLLTSSPHFFFFNDTATIEIYTLSLHDALPIFMDTFAMESTLLRCRNLAANGNNAAHEDRKSTRLNSSHLGISYAVFCLKK